MTALTLIQAVEQCKKLQERTGNTWFFEANKGSIKLVEGEKQQ